MNVVRRLSEIRMRLRCLAVISLRSHRGVTERQSAGVGLSALGNLNGDWLHLILIGPLHTTQRERSASSASLGRSRAVCRLLLCRRRKSLVRGKPDTDNDHVEDDQDDWRKLDES